MAGSNSWKSGGAVETSSVSYQEELPQQHDTTTSNTSMAASSSTAWDNDEDLSCTSCFRTNTITTDWAGGDRVCTYCGVVHTPQLLDTGPEWREYNNNNDDAGENVGKARCSMVPNDEAKYIGGLQPTTLSKHVFGGPTTSAAAASTTTSTYSSGVRERLAKANRRIDKLMERQHKKAYENAEINLKLLQRQQQQQQQQQREQDEDDDEPASAMAAEETSDVEPDYGSNVVWMEERPELEQQILEQQEQVELRQKALQKDKWSLHRAKNWESSVVEGGDDNNADDGDDDEIYRNAARDMNAAYELLVDVSNKLKLPRTIADEAASLLSRYCTKRDGFRVKGLGGKDGKKFAQPSLCASLLFWTARKRQRHRSLIDVCQQFQIQRKQCSKAMKEIKEHLPDAVVSNTTFDSKTGAIQALANKESVSSFVEHAVSKLNLPPVAESSVRCLVLHSSRNNKKCTERLSLLVASVAYFVCSAGSTMQQLAANNSRQSRKRPTGKGVWSSSPNPKRIKTDDASAQNKEDDTTELDLFETDTNVVVAEQRAYEMRRMWDAWVEQLPWARTLADMEQSMGVSKNVAWAYYKETLFPSRNELLQVLRDASSEDDSSSTGLLTEERAILQQTPLASVLLPQISIAAPLFKLEKKTPP